MSVLLTKFYLDYQSKKKGDGWGILHVWETRKVYIGIRWEDLKQRRHLEDLGVVRRIILKLISKEGGEEIDWFDLSRSISGGCIL
jgi:hypothetical protein